MLCLRGNSWAITSVVDPSFFCERQCGVMCFLPYSVFVLLFWFYYQPESEESSSQNSVPDVLEFQPHSNMPVMPPEWREREEKRKAEEAMRNTQGITIRRRPPTGPPLHNVGPFQFKIQSEGNTPRNILEEIVWHKDCEIAQVLLPKPSQQSLGLDSKNWQLEILMVQYAASFD